LLAIAFKYFIVQPKKPERQIKGLHCPIQWTEDNPEMNFSMRRKEA